jgi:hypothetical protein
VTYKAGELPALLPYGGAKCTFLSDQTASSGFGGESAAVGIVVTRYVGAHAAALPRSLAGSQPLAGVPGKGVITLDSKGAGGAVVVSNGDTWVWITWFTRAMQGFPGADYVPAVTAIAKFAAT